MNLNLDTLFVSEDDGTDRGHVLDFCHNSPERRAEVKGILDRAWANRDAQHRDAVRAKDAALSAVLDVHEDDATDVTLSADLAATVKQAKSAK